MWDLPSPGFEPGSPALAGGFLTTAPPGKFWVLQFCMVLCCCLLLFTSIWRINFSISCRTGLVLMNSLIFYSAEKVLISPLFSKGSFAGYSILHWHFGYIILFLSSLQSFCWEIQWWTNRSSLICDESHFFFVFKILYLSLIFHNLIMMYFCVDIFRLILLVIFYTSWICISISLLQIGHLGPLFLQICLLPFSLLVRFWNSHMHMLFFLMNLIP